MLDKINFIEIYLVLTLIYTLVYLPKREGSKIYLYLKLILVLNLFTEIGALIQLSNNKKLDLLYSISFIFHGFLWLSLLFVFVNNEKLKNRILILFSSFAFLNLIFFEASKMNFYTFIFGALLYLIIFIYESFLQLKNEAFTFFDSNNYILIFAPVSLFLGLSFIFGFRNYHVRDIIIFSHFNLYNLVSFFVNITLYTSINLFVYKEKKKYV